MGKLKRFEIILNNPQAVYYSGEVIQGQVTVELNEEMQMRGIRLHFYGGAQVQWSERHSTGIGRNRKTYVKNYRANETYFNYELVLFGKGAGGDNPTLHAGHHTYPFQYQLPEDIPSSFEGHFGRIRYWVNGTIDKPWKFNNTTKKAFTIISHVDLNTEPGAMDGVRGEGSKSLCCLCCKSGPISCKFQLDRSGYVPGESIPIKAEIINNSNRRMKRSFAELYMEVVYHADCKSMTCNQRVASTQIARGEILPGDSDIWNGELLRVPPLSPSELLGCRIIETNYFVKLCVDPSGPAFDLEVPLKIIIGSIPLRSTIQQYGVGPPEGLPPPPSFAESAFGVVNIRDDEDSHNVQENMQYTPMYTYYNSGNPATPSAHPAPPGT